MCEYAVEAKKINIGFDGVRVLHDLDFSVKKSEIHALVGTNGAGKSVSYTHLTLPTNSRV